MGRKKSNYVCDKCGEIGFRRTNPLGVVHYDHATGRRKTCCIKKFMNKPKGKGKGTTGPYPPKQFWGDSDLYYKLGNMANHFRKIADGLENVQWLVYRFKPEQSTSTQCVKDLEMFEKGFLNPVEKILLPYHDERWRTNWTIWFKIQMDSFKHGPRAAGIMNAIKTGQYIVEPSKDRKHFVEYPIEREFTSSQVKKKQQQVMVFANEILLYHALERALGNWSNNTEFEEYNPEFKLPDIDMEK